MPTDRIHIERLDPSVTPKGLQTWLVTGRYADGRLGGFQATTLSPFAATLCERSRQDGHDLLIQWRDVPGGKRITYVEPAVDPQEAA